MFNKLTKREQSEVDAIRSSIGNEAADAMAALILVTKKVQHQNRQPKNYGVNPFTGERVLNGGVNPFTNEKVGA
jgi:hypothetical protein